MPPENYPDQIVGVAETDTELELPELLPVLPLRNATAFPAAILPLNIGRPKSLKLVDDVLVESQPFGSVSYTHLTLPTN